MSLFKKFMAMAMVATMALGVAACGGSHHGLYRKRKCSWYAGGMLQHHKFH